jgi:zinc protease
MSATSIKINNSSSTLLRILATLALGIIATGAHASSAADFALRNGLRVIVRERHTAPLVAMELWVRAGAQAEAAGEFGAAHFLEHTLFKGTTTRNVGEADIAIENLGATLNASTGPDYARFYTNVPSGHAAAALAVLADVVRNATLPAKEIERERGVIVNELAQRRSDAESLLIDRLYALAYPGHAYARMPGGTEPTIGMQTRDSLFAFYRRAYRPDRCTLVFAGDLTVERAREIAEQSFGDWTARSASGENIAETGKRPADGGTLFPSELGVGGRRTEGQTSPKDDASALPTPQSKGGPRTTVAAADVAQPIIGIAYRGPKASAGPPVCAAQIVAALLGRSDVGGRLSVPQLSGTDTKVSFGPRQDSSLLVVTTTLPVTTLLRDRARTDFTAEISAQQSSVRAILDGLASLPPTAGELQAAKNALIGRMIFENETNTGLAFAFGVTAATSGMAPDEWRAAVERTTVAEVREFIQKWLDSAHRIDLVLVPASRRGESSNR